MIKKMVILKVKIKELARFTSQREKAQNESEFDHNAAVSRFAAKRMSEILSFLSLACESR